MTDDDQDVPPGAEDMAVDDEEGETVKGGPNGSSRVIIAGRLEIAGLDC